MTPFYGETLANGVVINFFDLSNRYFGDYHRVCVEARISVPIPERSEALVKVRVLERMGVAGAEVTTVRDRLVADFLHHASGYLGRPDYPARLLAAETAPRRRTGIVALHGH